MRRAKVAIKAANNPQDAASMSPPCLRITRRAQKGTGVFLKDPRPLFGFVPFSGSASQGSSCENVATETRCLRRRGRSLARRLDRCVANRFGWSGNTILYETHVPRTADLIGNTAPNNATSEGSDQGRE